MLKSYEVGLGGLGRWPIRPQCQPQSPGLGIWGFFLPPRRKVKTFVKIFRIAKIGEKWLSIGVPPHFSPKNFFSKMTQNCLKWILNTTFKKLTFRNFFTIQQITLSFLCVTTYPTFYLALTMKFVASDINHPTSGSKAKQFLLNCHVSSPRLQISL